MSKEEKIKILQVEIYVPAYEDDGETDPPLSLRSDFLMAGELEEIAKQVRRGDDYGSKTGRIGYTYRRF